MIDLFQKAFLAGVGATMLTVEKVEKALSQLVEKGRITTDEAKETAHRIIQEGQQEVQSVRQDLNRVMEDWAKRARLATAKDAQDFEQRLAKLERDVEALTPRKRPTAKKTVKAKKPKSAR